MLRLPTIDELRREKARRSLYDFLYANKVLVRYFASHALTASFLRISVGTDDEMQALNQKIDLWLKAAPLA